MTDMSKRIEEGAVRVKLFPVPAFICQIGLANTFKR